ncbi:MAG: ASCH domain-containing protein [Candidatus Nanosynbacter sp.]|nr:ASCH domain-containing protein [Candidatus Nanosynbacter sp.]
MTTRKVKISTRPFRSAVSGDKTAKPRLHKGCRRKAQSSGRAMLDRNIKHHQAAPARKMRIKKPYYDAIMSGRKTLEVRVGYGSIKRLRIGELLQLETSHESGAVQIKSIRTYDNFAKMLAAEDWRQIVPQAKDRAEALRLLQKIYPPRKEKLGVYAIEVAKSESSAVQCMS